MTGRAVMVLRHGKSDWAVGHGRDMIRPLNPRGTRSAAAVGRFLATVGHVPDLVLCSPATRARQTADLAIESGSWACPLEVCDELYGTGPSQAIDLLHRQPDDAAVIMVVGHEPTSSQLVAELIGGGRHRIPTAALARIDVQIGRWGQLTGGCGRLEWLVPSRVLLAADI